MYSRITSWTCCGSPHKTSISRKRTMKAGVGPRSLMSLCNFICVGVSSIRNNLMRPCKGINAANSSFSFSVTQEVH